MEYVIIYLKLMFSFFFKKLLNVFNTPDYSTLLTTYPKMCKFQNYN